MTIDLIIHTSECFPPAFEEKHIGVVGILLAEISGADPKTELPVVCSIAWIQFYQCFGNATYRLASEIPIFVEDIEGEVIILSPFYSVHRG